MPREPLTRAEIAALIDDFDARCARTETAGQAGRLCREFAGYAVDGRATLPTIEREAPRSRSHTVNSPIVLLALIAIGFFVAAMIPQFPEKYLAPVGGILLAIALLIGARA